MLFSTCSMWKWVAATRISLSKFLANQNGLLFGINHIQKDNTYRDKIIKRAQITAEFGYGIRLLADRGTNIVLWATLSGHAGYETINGGRRILHDGATLLNKDCFVGGISSGAELDLFLSDRIILNLTLRERLSFGMSVGNFNCLTTLELKYLIN